jgi:PhoH-like ATPase
MSSKKPIKEIVIPDSSFESLYELNFLNEEIAQLLKLKNGDFCFVTNSQNKKTVVLSINGTVKLIDSFKNKSINGFAPKDLKQVVYCNLLEEPSVSIIAALGAAGTGKTTLALAKAISNYFSNKKKIYLCKPTHLVSSHENQVFGPVPGDMQEKYAPYIGSFEIILNKMLGASGRDYLQTMLDKKHIEFMPVEFTRGCTFENCTFVLDECQNLTWHELKTVLSRIGANSKIILCGDPNQIDAGFKYSESGLYTLLNSESFQNSKFTSKIELTKQYRGLIPDLIYNIDKELNKDKI